MEEKLQDLVFKINIFRTLFSFETPHVSTTHTLITRSVWSTQTLSLLIEEN